MKSPQISEENRWVINILRNWLKLFTQYPTHIHIILCTNKKTMLFRPSSLDSVSFNDIYRVFQIIGSLNFFRNFLNSMKYGRMIAVSHQFSDRFERCAGHFTAQIHGNLPWNHDISTSFGTFYIICFDMKVFCNGQKDQIRGDFSFCVR